MSIKELPHKQLNQHNQSGLNCNCDVCALFPHHLRAPREVVVREHAAPGPGCAALLLGRVVDEGAAVVDGEALQAVVEARLGQVLADVQQLRPRQDVLLQ